MSEADRYRLSPLRDVRSRNEHVKRGDLAAAVGDARATEAQVGKAAERVARERAALEAARIAHTALLGALTTSAIVARSEQFLVRKRRDLDAALDAHARVLADHRGQLDLVDAARDRLGRARADKELIERHFARWRTERARLADRRDD